MRNLTLSLLLLVILFCASGCAEEAVDEGQSSPVAGKVYLVNSVTDSLGWKWCKFYGDGTYQGIDSKLLGTVNGEKAYSRKSVYGSYSLDGSVLIMNSGEAEFSAVIKDDGARILIGDVELLDYTEKLAEDPIMDEFEQ